MRAERLAGAPPRRLGRVRAPRAALRRVLPGTPWGREWLVTLAHPRALAIRVVVPLLLAVPLVAGGAPTFWAAMLLSVLVAMVGAVGSGMTLARARASGHLARLAVTPGPPWRAVGAWVLAAASVDLLQLTPALGVAALGGGGGAAAAATLLLTAGAALLVANVLGCALALLAGGASEVLLDVSVVLAPLLFLGGLFTGVPRARLAPDRRPPRPLQPPPLQPHRRPRWGPHLRRRRGRRRQRSSGRRWRSPPSSPWAG